MANQIDARIQLKIDTEVNWIANASNFRPKLGELIIYSPDEEYSSPRFKVGDGSTLLNRLPFSNGDLTMKNDTYSGWYNSDYIPKVGEIIIINSETASEPAQVRIGDGSTLVKDLPAFGGASGSSANAQKLVNSNGQGLNVATQGNRLVYFKDGIPTASNIYVYKTVPQDAVLTELATETEKGLLAPEEKILLNELSEKAITKDNISSSLPTASETVKGGVMIGENLTIDNGVLSAVIPDSEEIEDATTTASGLMSAEDKIKLNNIEAEANKTIVDSALNSTSTNPVENKVINSAISGLNSLISTSNQSTLAAAENFTKNQIAELIGSAPETLNTLGEIADAMENNKDVVEALDEAIGTKANASDLAATSSKLDLHVTNKNNPHEVSKAQVGLGNVENKSVSTIKNEILTEENISALGFIKEVPEYSAPVISVNGQAGEVQLTAADVGALPNDTIIPEAITVDDSLTSTGINPVQGKVIYSALAGKQPTGDYVTKEYLTNQKYLTGISKTDVTTALGYTPPQSDTNTTYSAGTGLSLSGTTFNIKTGYTDNNKNYKVQTDSYGNLYVNVPWENTVYTLSSTKITAALGYTPAKSSDISTINATLENKVDKVSGKGLSTNDFTAAYKTKLDGIAANATANTGTITGVTAGTGLSGGGTSSAVTLNHSNSITKGSVGSAQTASFGKAFTIPKITYDAQGHITEATTVNVTLPSAPSIDTSDFLTSSDLNGYVKSTSLGSAAYVDTTSIPTINVLSSYNQNLSGKKGDLQVII